MSQISEVNEQILTRILKSDEFYEALWGKEDFTPNSVINVPNDYNCGALANPLEYVYDFIREITGLSLDELPEPYIDIVVFFFTGFQRFSGESDDSLLNRMESILVREGDWRSERFGTPWDIKNVLSYYLDRSLIFFIPNYIQTDLILNGNFDDAVAAEWVFSPSGDRTIENAFVGNHKADFTDFQSLAQDVAVTPGSYILNSFVKPLEVTPSGDTFNLIIQRDSDGFYFNTTSLLWDVSLTNNLFSTDSTEYTLSEYFIIVDGTYNINLKFDKIIPFYLDRIELGLKICPAFEIVYIDSGIVEGFAYTWSVNFNFELAAYTDQNFMFDSTSSSFSDTYYQDLLDTLKASGIKAVFSSEFRVPTPVPPDPISYNLATSEEELITTSDGFIIEIFSL